jgi:hypothetical protein
MVVDTGSAEAVRYADLCRTFRHIRAEMPKLDGYELKDDLLDLNAIFLNRMDAKECGEVSAKIGVEQMIFPQGDTLSEYRFRPAIRAAARIDVLRGTTFKAPRRWSDLHRNPAFSLVRDLRDIIKTDWPTAKPAIEAELYGPMDPIPVGIRDLASLVKAAPAGPVIIALKWEALNAAQFERLIFSLVSQANAYTNPKWLMHTNAPDRGPDVSVERVRSDPLTGVHTSRVIVQRKHWRGRSIGVAEITALIMQMKHSEPPKAARRCASAAPRSPARGGPRHDSPRRRNRLRPPRMVGDPGARSRSAANSTQKFRLMVAVRHGQEGSNAGFAVELRRRQPLRRVHHRPSGRCGSRRQIPRC